MLPSFRLIFLLQPLVDADFVESRCKCVDALRRFLDVRDCRCGRHNFYQAFVLPRRQAPICTQPGQIQIQYQHNVKSVTEEALLDWFRRKLIKGVIEQIVTKMSVQVLREDKNCHATLDRVHLLARDCPWCSAFEDSTCPGANLLNRRQTAVKTQWPADRTVLWLTHCNPNTNLKPNHSEYGSTAIFLHLSIVYDNQ